LLVALFKLSSHFLQDKVPHDYLRILPEMTLSRFAALQLLTFAVVVAVLMYLLSPILMPFAATAILLAEMRHGKSWCLPISMQGNP
jgi:hypothetical protein